MIRAAPSDPPLDASLSEETRVGVEALVRYEGKVFALFSFYYKTENTSPVIRCRRAARSIHCAVTCAVSHSPPAPHAPNTTRVHRRGLGHATPTYIGN